MFNRLLLHLWVKGQGLQRLILRGTFNISNGFIFIWFIFKRGLGVQNRLSDLRVLVFGLGFGLNIFCFWLLTVLVAHLSILRPRTFFFTSIFKFPYRILTLGLQHFLLQSKIVPHSEGNDVYLFLPKHRIQYLDFPFLFTHISLSYFLLLLQKPGGQWGQWDIRALLTGARYMRLGVWVLRLGLRLRLGDVILRRHFLTLIIVIFWYSYPIYN